MKYDDETLHRLWGVETGILRAFIRICDKHEIPWFVTYGTQLGATRHQGFIPWDDDMDVGMLYEDYRRFVDVAAEELGDDYELLNTETNPEYACSVTKLQKKGTAFVSEDGAACKVKPGINVDIFVFYPVSDDEKTANKQYRRAWFWGRLLFLRGEGKPFLAFGGVKAAICRVIFKLVHVGLCVLGISKTMIYRKMLSACLMCRGQQTKRLAPFESPDMRKETIPAAALFPLREMEFEGIKVKAPGDNDTVLKCFYGDYMTLPPLEKRVSHRPYLIDFGDDKNG